MKRLPPQFVEENTALAENIRILGVPLRDLDREEAIAVAAHAFDLYGRQRQIAEEALKTAAEALQVPRERKGRTVQ